MEINVGPSILELVEGDITRQDTDAVVNAANAALRPGGGVDGAIHRAGGPAIEAECRRLGGCPPGKPDHHRRRPQGQICNPHRGPGLSGRSAPEAGAYALMPYRESLKLASAKGIKSLAFPSISTGVYGYPMEDTARVALKTVKDYLTQHPEIERVRFVLFGRVAYEVYERALQEV